MAKRLLCIDPGPVKSGWILMDGEKPLAWGWEWNSNVKERFAGKNPPHMVLIEYPKPRGMPTSKEEMDTLFEAGRLVEAWGGPWSPVYRSDVKLTLCGHMRAKDANIRQAIIDRYGGDRVAIGAIKCKACKGKGWRGRGRPECPECTGSGYEAAPGPLHGISGHAWSALAVGLTYLDMERLK